jgi:hypothetical protein
LSAFFLVRKEEATLAASAINVLLQPLLVNETYETTAFGQQRTFCELGTAMQKSFSA